MKSILRSSIPIALIWILTCQNDVTAKRILAVLPVASYSHQIVYRPLILALHKRGHEIVVLTPNPLNNRTLTNYTELDFSSAYNIIRNVQQFMKNTNVEAISQSVLDRAKIAHAKSVFEHPEMKKLYAKDSNQTFDLVISEGLVGPAIYAFAHRFNAPIIGIMSVDLHVRHYYYTGMPLLPSHQSNWEFYKNVGTNISFWQRIQNFINVWWRILEWEWYMLPIQQEIVRKHLPDTPDMVLIKKNVDMYIVDHHPALGYSRPIAQNIIFVHGLHISKNPPALPQNVKTFLDNATEGFIYISFGTNFPTRILKAQFIKSIINIITKLPCKVIFKWDNNDLPDLDNAFFSKWLPQQTILAHPNIKGFITQGGLQSMEESIHYGVPVVGIPISFEQPYRTRKIDQLGAGINIPIEDFTEEKLYDAIYKILYDPSYKANMLKLRSLVMESPIDPLENAVWWTEYVMRHKGVPHLQYDGRHLPWYQKDDMDIIAFLSIAFFSATFLFLRVLLQCILWSWKALQSNILYLENRKKVD